MTEKDKNNDAKIIGRGITFVLGIIILGVGVNDIYGPGPACMVTGGLLVVAAAILGMLSYLNGVKL